MEHNKVRKTENDSTAASNSNAWEQFEDDNDDFLLVNEDVNLNTSSLRTDEKYVGFDNNFGDSWIYPSNFPERAYQYNIVQKALFQNTLVVLPTGLGKTFIAAVVMYNMYRWYPMGKVVFMAPTRPLVTQQIDACCKIMGIPAADSVEITGKLNKAKRAQLWQTKRVFFATPQSVQSDIMDAELDFPFHAIKLVVVDEAHRAKGRYCYTEVISTIWRKNKYFRILALSATPGRRKEDVEEVIRNLFISNLEVRTEDSVDVVRYVHKRLIKTVVVELGERLTAIRDELLTIADPHLRNLIDNHLISGRSGSISRNWLVMEQKRFRESLVNNRVPQQKELSSDFSICISIYHAIELLERHGTRVFLNNFDDTDGTTKFVVILRPDLRRLIERIRQETGPNPFAFSDQCMVNGEIAPIPRNIDFGHPKFEIARDHVLEHFQKNKDARCIIFCEYRESVMLMHRLLLQHRPLIRPRVFVGQGGTGSIRAVTQQQQIKVMNEFRSGESNALIATSVAEEGIDVGEVDFIVCFDINTSNPTRFIQRIGRTGRKKEGKVLLLATEGKENAVLKEVLSERNRLNKSISRGGEFTSAFYKQGPRMVPTEFNPKCLKTFVQSKVFEVNAAPIKKSKKKSESTKNRQPRDLRHFFKPKVVLNKEEIGVFENFSESPLNASAKSKLNVDHISTEEQAIIDFSPVKASKVDDRIMRKMTKYIKTATKGKTMDVQKVLTSNKLSKSSLEFLINYSPDLVCNIWSHMKTLWEKGVNEDNLPTKGLTAEERKAVKSYFNLIDILGSKDMIVDIMSNHREHQNNFSKLYQKYRKVFGNLYTYTPQDNFDTLTEKLEKLSSLMLPNNSRAESFAQSMVYDVETENESLQHSIQPEDSRDYSTDYILDSKYMSQWDEPSNVSHSFQQTSNKQMVCPRKSITKENIENCSSDDEVMFVGVTQQSTPIRTGFTKQTLLNFKNVQVENAVSNKFMDNGKDMTMKKNQRVSPIISSDKQPDIENEDFFDDQFDDIIAANSIILARIESSSLSQRVIPKDSIPPSLQNVDIKFSNQSSPPKHNISSNKTELLTAVRNKDICTSNPAGDSLLRSNKNNVHFKTDSNTNILPIINLEPASERQLKTINNVKEVHPELADIDFNNFSEVFSDEMDNSFQTISHEKDEQRNSPDIFEDLSQHVSKTDIIHCKTPSKIMKSPSVEVSPCLLTKKALTWKEVRLKYGNSETEIKTALRKPNENVIETNESVAKPNESVINVPVKKRLKRRIIDSDSDSSEQSFSMKLNTKEENNTRSSKLNEIIQKSSFKKPRLNCRNLNEFIDDEAVHSGSATEDEIEQTQGYYMLDSVVVHDDDVENDQVNMTGVYLQSVRSPCKSSIGKFKIPSHHQYNDASKIFSQKVPEDNGSYEQDSFIISDEEAEVDRSMCPLERAEEILKNRRRARRKAKLSNNERFQILPKKKRVLRILNESDEDFE